MKKIDIRLEITQSEVVKPERATAYSAGYDVYAPLTIRIPPFAFYTLELPFLFTYNHLIPNETTFLFTPRSSYGIKKKLRLIDVDSRFIANFKYNDISKCLVVYLYNDSPEELIIPKNEHFLQFILTKEEDKWLPVTFKSVSSSTKERYIPFPGYMQEKNNEYDWILEEDLFIHPKEQVVLSTGYKASFNHGAWLTTTIHPSYCSRVVFANGTPVIDADYYDNEENEGLIFLAFVNISEQPLVIPKETAVCSFHASPFYLLSDDEGSNIVRTGGIGHTSL
ncbi:hypothetical protein CN918_32660 [Priestia megaterium]|nr:hypothetical protein CN918_32660 [Priestia megaterium]